MLKITVYIGTMSVEISGESQKDLIRQAAFWSEIPAECPLCQSPIRFSYRAPKDNQYWGLQCTGPVTHETNLGVYKDLNLGLYYKHDWKEAFAGRQSNDNYQDDYHEPSYTQQAPGGNPVASTLGDMITSKQLGMIRAIARERGVNADTMSEEVFQCSVEELSKRAASELIGRLQSYGGQSSVPPQTHQPPAPPATYGPDDDIPF